MELASSAILMETLWMLSLLQAKSRDMEFSGELATFVTHVEVINITMLTDRYDNGDQREGFFSENILDGQVIFTR